MARAASCPIGTTRSLRPLPRTLIVRFCRSTSLRPGSSGQQRIPAISPARIPVARSTAITAASRRCANVRPAQVRSILARSWSPKTGTGLSGVIADGNQ